MVVRGRGDEPSGAQCEPVLICSGGWLRLAVPLNRVAHEAWAITSAGQWKCIVRRTSELSEQKLTLTFATAIIAGMPVVYARAGRELGLLVAGHSL